MHFNQYLILSDATLIALQVGHSADHSIIKLLYLTCILCGEFNTIPPFFDEIPYIISLTNMLEL